MLQVNYIRENKEDVLKRLAIKNFKDAEKCINEILEKDAKRRAVQKTTDDLKAEANSIAKQIGELMKTGKKEEAEKIKLRTSEIKLKEKELDDELAEIEKQIHAILVTIPNTPNLSVPLGKTPEDNATVFEHGNKPVLYAKAMPHWELTTKYDLIDFELGVKIAGAGFPVYKGKGARLQRALINFFLDRATAAGYLEIQPPIVVNEDSGYGTGQLPDKEGQMYHVGIDNLYLIPTAEVPVTNIYRDVILKETDLPIKNCGYTPCFRREAGSYGKDVRGLNRLHQFDKVEIVQIAHPAQSYEVLEEMRNYVAGLLKELELPFRTLKLCGGDMSFASALTYDMEVWSAAQQRWLEVSSVSNFETFQTNRLKCRFKDGSGKTQLAHSLNGSALALPRIVAALLENNQTENGIKIPSVLIPYCGFDTID
ncbi:MAG: serine--tRNA ligase [Bacteroidetes bacterium]|jgi:seryl-tRNA synthetase|nr:serine--tRNA ligase [Bacteroidota bacterium]MCA6444438.1 serine--tRNA ligase [Bacteroidota bacterium]